jgi:hypothetical protein
MPEEEQPMKSKFVRVGPKYCSLFLFVILSSQATGATIHVYPSGFTSGGCTLRDAISAANLNVAVGGCNAGSAAGTDTLQLELPRPYTLTATFGSDEDANASGDLDVTSSIVVQGVNATQTMIIGPEFDRVFDVLSPGALTINDVTVVGGSVAATASPYGGVVRKGPNTALTVNRSVLRGGTAVQGGAVYASGSGVLTLNRIAIFDNLATYGGGISLQQGTGIEAVLNNLTLSGNTAITSGGGLYASSWFRLKNSTIARNRSGPGGGGIHYGGASTTGVNLANSLLIDNTRSGGLADDLQCNSSQLGSRSYTMIGAISNCMFASFSGIPSSSDARISPLFDFGTGVPTHALMPGSAALNAGNPSSSNANTACLSSDARGVSRSAPCDVGAYEQTYSVTLNSFSDFPDANPGDGLCLTAGNICTLRAAVMEGSALGGRWIVNVPPGTYLLNIPIIQNDDRSGGDLDIRPASASVPPLAMTLLGSGDPGATRIVGGGFDRVIEVRGRFASGASFVDRPLAFALINVTVEGGSLSQDPFVQLPGSEPEIGGGGIKVFGAKTLFYNVVIKDNHVDVDPFVLNGIGGGVSITLPYTGQFNEPYFTSAVMDRFAVVDNSAANVSGGIYARGVNASARSDGIVFVNGTIAGNHAIYNGALLAQDSVAANFLTITDNTSEIIEAGVNTNYAAGVSVFGTNNSFRNTLISGNQGGAVDSDCEVGVSGSLVSLGYNLIGSTGDGCVISGDTASIMLNVNPQLGTRVLLDSGMPVYPLAPTSPAVAVIPRTYCVDASGFGVLTDARGATRPVVGQFSCDLGALEGELPIFSDGFE